MWDVLETAIDNEDYFNNRMRDDGDVVVALETDDLIEAEYRVPYLAHAPMEPLNAIVLLTDTKCEIWSGAKAPIWTLDKAAALIGLAPENVRVYVQQMGGSFGHRVEIKNVEQAVEIALAVKGTPVKMTWSREENMTHEFSRPPAIARGRGKVSNGQVDKLDLSVSQAAVIPLWLERNSGKAMPGPDPSIGHGSWDQPFTIPNYRVTTYRTPDMVPVSTWRSVGASGNAFMHDTFMDELIHAAGADPLAERVRLYFDETSRKVIEEVGKISGWDGPSLGENRGRGIAFCMSFGVPVAQVVEVTNTSNGIKIDKAFIVADVGTVLDPKNAEAQLFGGKIYGLGHAINSELTYENYAPQQNNYHANEGLRLFQTPEFEMKILENGHHIRGHGEPGVPPAAPALGNAIFAATGQRIREMPFHKHINFV